MEGVRTCTCIVSVGRERPEILGIGRAVQKWQGHAGGAGSFGGWAIQFHGPHLTLWNEFCSLEGSFLLVVLSVFKPFSLIP